MYMHVDSNTFNVRTLYIYLPTCTGWSKARVRRNAQGAHSSAHSARVEGAWGGRWVAGVCVGVAGLIGILASLAMCAHSSQDYDTDVPITR